MTDQPVSTASGPFPDMVALEKAASEIPKSQQSFQRGFFAAWSARDDEVQRLREALEPLVAWAEKNHEMPGYSEVIYNARLALKDSGR